MEKPSFSFHESFSTSSKNEKSVLEKQKTFLLEKIEFLQEEKKRIESIQKLYGIPFEALITDDQEKVNGVRMQEAQTELKTITDSLDTLEHSASAQKKGSKWNRFFSPL